MKYLSLCLTMLLATALAFADDGELQIKNVSKTPDWDTEHTSLQQLWFYVPAQNSQGESEPVIYVPLPEAEDDADGFETEREYVRPLIAFYEDGPVEFTEDSGGFYGHGERDMYGALSLNDGASWKKTNLSKSASKSSIKIKLAGRKKVAYPGDVFRNFTASAGNRVLAVWASRYCDSGNPNYSMTTEDIEAIFAAAVDDNPPHLGNPVACTDDDPSTQCFYFEDYWHVNGSQKIKDFADEDYPSVGLVPYACLWAARGSLEPVFAEDEITTTGHEMVWRQAERLTSGVRDVHRMEAACVGGAGCVITWQEDPDGLRPGKGEGPGEGWSGAIAHHETDIWYSYIDWDNFGLVKTDALEIVPISEYEDSGTPKIAVPFSMPVRLTDNAKCVMPDGEDSDDPYCYMDMDSDGTVDICAESVSFEIVTPEGPTQNVDMCIAQDGRLMRGNTASTRTRTNLRGYDSTIDEKGPIDSGWVILAYEESKGLGEETDEDPDKIDMGKNIWYHTFDMFHPELVSQGMMLNQPAIYPADFDLGELIGYDLTEDDASNHGIDSPEGYFAIIDPDPIYDAAGLDTTILYQTEIARRYSQITQPASKVGDSDTVALAMYKQGVVRQGGPADVFGRRFTIPDGFDPGAHNPFDYWNMDCAQWQFQDGSNPRYVKGLCMSTPQNLSGTTVVDCEDGLTNCEMLGFPYDELFADIDKSTTEGGITKITEWRQCDPEANDEIKAACTFDSTVDTDLDDQSWENPYDLSKGHRGFIYGDFIVMMYAWSPNWEANTMGHDNYNLYVRRSFDGGVTWTTYPGDVSLPDGAGPPTGIVADGSTSCEWYGVPGGDTESAVCFEYVAGEFEQARNLSQLVGTHYTVLDPRFTGTDPSFLGDITKMLDGSEGPLYPDDAVDPSKFFATYEEGDTEEISEGGEGTPMDMFYARAINFGDEYEMPEPEEEDELPIFDRLEWKDPHAAEAALKTNPGGTLFYAIWNEWMETDTGYVYDSDAMVRRIMELGYYVGDDDPAPNLLPDAVDDTASTTVGVPVSGNVLGNDDPGDAPATVTAFDASSVEGGTVTVAANGDFTYTPPGTYEGSDSFGYTITDANGDSDSATVYITIGPDPNLLPDAVDDTASTTVGVPVSGNVLGNDDPGDAPATVTAFDASSVEGGTVTIAANGDFTYTPPGTYEGSDSFGYTITDANGDSDSATVYITIGPSVTGFTLTIDTYAKGAYRYTRLNWDRIESAMMEIYRDGSLIRTVNNIGYTYDFIGVPGGENSYEYRVCEVEPAGACATATANY